MPIRSACFALLVAALPSTLLAQRGGRIVDEGTFTVTRPGAPPLAESFRITRNENDLLQATAQSSAGSRRMTSRLIADSTGLPTDYGMVVLEGRDTLFRVRVAGSGGRLSATSSNRRGDESMREYPSAPATIIVDDDLVHLAFFAAIGNRARSVHLINPRTGATANATWAGIAKMATSVNERICPEILWMGVLPVVRDAGDPGFRPGGWDERWARRPFTAAALKR